MLKTLFFSSLALVSLGALATSVLAHTADDHGVHNLTDNQMKTCHATAQACDPGNTNDGTCVRNNTSCRFTSPP